MKRRNILFSLILLIFPVILWAHQPKIPAGNDTVVREPEISKAFYTRLDGTPHIYRLDATEPFDFYVNILVPDEEGISKDLKVEISKGGDLLAALDGTNFEWKKFFEPYAYDRYLLGPEYDAMAGAGSYEIKVTSPKNDLRYALAIGKKEDFGPKEIWDALMIIPVIKRDFFQKSPADFLFSRFGGIYAGIMLLLGFAGGFIYRIILRAFARSSTRRVRKNIGLLGRLFRAFLGIVLFVLAITTSWSPLLLFFAGFTFFEAIFSWCGFYAAIGRNSCSITT